MRNISRYLYIFLSLAIAALFLYSAYTKLYPIQSFEYTMVEYVHLPWVAAAIAARFFIGLEGALGILIALHLFGRGKWVLKLSFALLCAFSVYLVYLWATAGNDVNCGCFGDSIWMSPSASLIKNAVMLVLVGLLIKYHTGFTLRGKLRFLPPAILVICIALTYILFALPDNQPSWLRTDRYEIDFSEIGIVGGSTPILQYGPGVSDSSAKQGLADSTGQLDLHKGKHIVAFFSQACPHCRIAAYKMHLLKEKNPNIPFFMIIGGTTSDLTDFWKATKAQNIPYTRLDKGPFLHYTGGVFPLILWVNKGWVEAKADYITLTQAEIEKWLAE